MSKPRILALYYSQSGQLRDILEHIVQDLNDKADIDFVGIEPTIPFPFPWNAYAFFDAMPETVAQTPITVNPLPKEITEKNYDLIIFGYQPWFLHPSQPVLGFLKSQYAAILKDKPVLTVIGCRNMWLHGQEVVKRELKNLGAHLMGNIVLTDSYPNLISTLTVIRWAFTGQKEAKGLLPAAGVQDHDIKRASRFGIPIYHHLTQNKLDELHHELLLMGAVQLNPGLILLEQKGIKNFRKFADWIREKGGPGDTARKERVVLFKRLLIVGIFILSPITSVVAFIKLQLKKKQLIKDVAYYKGIEFEKNKL